MTVYVCLHCEYRFDSEKGDPAYDIPAGATPADMPDVQHLELKHLLQKKNNSSSQNFFYFLLKNYFFTLFLLN